MGSCFSKKNDSSSSSGAVSTRSTSVESVDPNKSSNNNTQKVETEQKIKKKMVQEEEGAKKEKEKENTVKKEIFLIKHRKSHDRRSPPQQNAVDVADGALYSSTSTEEMGNNICNGSNNVVVRTSSCTKEEVDAILIQCGRLSRNNSSGKTASSSKKNSSSKRSFDFDHNEHENDQNVSAPNADYDSTRRGNYSYYDDDEAAEKRQHRHRHRQSGRPSPQRRRRTPSREREQQQKQQRSGSRERGSGNGNGRRLSKSPGRRSETTPNSTTSFTTATVNANANSSSNKIGKMVYVPATVSSLVMDKSNNGGNANNAGAVETTAIKRISVKRNVGEEAAPVPGAASPRSQSPARTNAKGSNENQQMPSLSRSSSRKAEQSPYRRNPLSEIDPNSLAYPQSAGNKASCTNSTREQNRNKEIEVQGMPKVSPNLLNQKPNSEMSNNRVVCNKSAREQQPIGKESKTEPSKTGNITVTTVVGSGGEGLKAQTLTRSRSSRRSRDLDLKPEALLNSPPSYTTLLLEDIQNFHQKTVSCTPTLSQ